MSRVFRDVEAPSPTGYLTNIFIKHKICNESVEKALLLQIFSLILFLFKGLNKFCFFTALFCHSCMKKNRVKTWFFISTLYCYFFLSFMLLIKITRCTTTAANIKIVPQTLIIKGTSVKHSKTFISVQKNQQIEAINHKILTFFIIITDL